MSSVFGLKARPSSAMVFPRTEPRWRSSFASTRRFCSSFTSITADEKLEVVAGVRGQLLERERVLREAAAAVADPGTEEARADTVVETDPSATLTTSAPVASQTFAISLMNEIRVISAAFAASLIISADATSQRTIGASIPSWSSATASPSSSRNAPTTMRSGVMKSRSAVPSAVNSGFDA